MSSRAAAFRPTVCRPDRAAFAGASMRSSGCNDDQDCQPRWLCSDFHGPLKAAHAGAFMGPFSWFCDLPISLQMVIIF